MLYVIKYIGVTGFIKPWSSLADVKTISERYLYPSTIMGIERHLFPELLINDNLKINKIKRFRLDFSNISIEQETTSSIPFISGKGKNKCASKPTKSIIKRGIMVNPRFYIAFDNKEDAKEAQRQHICLSRNEDLLYSKGDIIEFENEEEFENQIAGFETLPSCESNNNSILMGYNRYTQDKQYGIIKIFGEPELFKNYK